MLDTPDLALHGLTLRQLATAEQLADVLGEDASVIGADLDAAVSDGAVIAARGAFMITPAGRERLDGRYPTSYADRRADTDLLAALDDFEHGVNKQMLAVMTSWQTVSVDGEQQPNDHSDADYDAKVIDRLARVHDRVVSTLEPFAAADPLTARFLDRLGTALTTVDQGDHDYVSNVRLDSYHTVWYQMHEHLLRMMGQERDE